MLANKEDKYQDFLSDKKVSLTRMMCILSIILFASFSIVDIWAIPSAFETTLAIRGMTMCALLVAYSLTFTQVFIKYYNVIVATTYIVATIAVEAMIHVAAPTDQAYETYFVGVILILITLFSWTYLKLTISISLALFSVAVYISIEVIDRNFIETERTAALITNIFLLVSAAIIGFAAQVIRDRYLKENFFLQQALETSLEEKTEEAKDNDFLAKHDELTSLPNRRYAIEKLERALEDAKEKNKSLVIMFVDLNGFKQVNDNYGHSVGDEVLKITARRLELSIREADCLSRLGGDEFLIGLLIEKENILEVENMAKKFSSIISRPINVRGIKVEVGASIGLSAYPIHGNQVNVLLDIADKKMYKVKHEQKRKTKEQESDIDGGSTVDFPSNTNCYVLNNKKQQL